MDETSTDINGNVFALDVQIISDVMPGPAARACTTDDGCDPTCASSCAST